VKRRYSFNPKWVVGRTIQWCDYPVEKDGDGNKLHSPVMQLDNGARLVFVAEEGDGDSGVAVIYIPAARLSPRKETA